MVPKPLTVASIGNLTLDHLLFVESLPALDEVALINREQECLGGRGAIVALILASLGVPVFLCTAVGGLMDSDAIGFLKKSGVNTDCINVESTPVTTSEVFIAIGHEQKNCVSFFLPKQLSFTPSPNQKSVISSADILYFTTHDLSFNLHLLEGVQDKFVVHNFSRHMLAHPGYLAAIIQSASIIVANADDFEALLKQLTIKTPTELIRLAPRLGCIVLTKGEFGAHIWTGSEDHIIPAMSTEVVAPVGLGDAFAAGILYGTAYHLPITTSARIGNALAAESAASQLTYPVLENLKARISFKVGIDLP